MSPDDPDRDEDTPLPPPSRQSELDMERSFPKLTLEAAEKARSRPNILAPAPAAAKPRVDHDISDTKVDPDPTAAHRDDESSEPSIEIRASTPRPDDDDTQTDTQADVEPALPHVVAPHTRPIVWGALVFAVGALAAIGTFLGTGQLGIVVTGAVVGVVGVALAAVGLGRYAWSKNDLWLDAGTLFAREGALPTLAILTIGMVYLYSGMFGGELVGDDLSFHMAEARRISDCLAVGDFDLWNPSANAGFASAYYYQVIPQLASALPAAVFGHFLFFFQLSVFLPLVLAPAAAYRGMRLLGATPWQALFAAIAVGLMNGESRWGTGNAGTFNVGLYTQTWALAALPLAIGYAARWLRDGRGLATAVAWGTFVFLCHPFAGVSLAFIVGIGLVVNSLLRGLDAFFHAAIDGLPAFSKHPMMERATQHLAARWRTPPDRGTPWWHEWARAVVLGACLLLTWSPIYLPLLIDKAGFGGFPHRVGDEVGPGFLTLWQWWKTGAILDFGGKLSLLTMLFLPLFLFARGQYFRYLWWPALFFALLLGLGPHIGTTQNDLFPAVRFLGAMQIGLALAIGAGTHVVGGYVWRAKEGTFTLWFVWLVLLVVVGLGGPLLAVEMSSAAPGSMAINFIDVITLRKIEDIATLRLVGLFVSGGLTLVLLPIVFFRVRNGYAIRTILAAVGAAAGVFLVVGHAGALRNRVHTLPEYEHNHPSELRQIIAKFEQLPPGRKQVASGAENHWWNLLTYVYAERPALLQMGGGGLQASPNYDFLWNIMRQYEKNAHLYDAPYLVFAKGSAATMPKGDIVFDTDNYEIRKLPAAALVSPITITGELPGGENGKDTPTRNAALAWIKSEAPMRDEMLAYEGSGPAGPVGDGKTIRAWRQDSPGDAADIVAEVSATKPTTFVVRESWHPRWHAYLDGNEVPVRRVTPDFPALDVPIGTHTITLRFERPWWAWACWLLWPGVCGLAWLVLRRRRRTLPKARAL